MVHITNLIFLAAGASAAVIVARSATPAQVQTIENDLAKINTDVNTLTTDTKNWDGSFAGAFTVENDESNVDNDIKQATKDAQAITSTFAESDAVNVINYINNTLEPSIRAAIAELESRKSAIVNAGLESTVESDFKQLKSDTDALGAALIALAPSDQVSNAQAALAKIDNDLQGAINFFSS